MNCLRAYNYKLSDDDRIIEDLVVFDDVKLKYDKSKTVEVEFTIDPEVRASTRDWIGVYEAGWNSFISCLAYEWGIGCPVESSRRTRRIKFPPELLQKAKPSTHYQFVYVSQYLQILGVSKYFQFIDGSARSNLYESFMSPGGVQHFSKVCSPVSTNRRDKKSYQNNNISPVCLTTNQGSNCKLNLPQNLNNVFTTCCKCKGLFDLLDQHKELNLKYDSCLEENRKLKERIDSLEKSVSNIQLSPLLENLSEPWDNVPEQARFYDFMLDVCGPVDETLANSSGDGGTPTVERDQTLVHQQQCFSPDDLMGYDDMTRREILFKAVIGSQELKIRQLAALLFKINKSQQQNLNVVQQPQSSTIEPVKMDIVTVKETPSVEVPVIVEINRNQTDALNFKCVMEELNSRMNDHEEESNKSNAIVYPTKTEFPVDKIIS